MSTDRRSGHVVTTSRHADYELWRTTCTCGWPSSWFRDTVAGWGWATVSGEDHLAGLVELSAGDPSSTRGSRCRRP